MRGWKGRFGRLPEAIVVLYRRVYFVLETNMRVSDDGRYLKVLSVYGF